MRYFLLTFLGWILFSPTSEAKDFAFESDWARGYIQSIDSAKKLTVLSAYSEFRLGEMLVVQSHDPGQDIIGFVQVESITSSGEGQYLLSVRLIRHSKYAMIQVGDVLYRMDFSTYHEEYKGTTELLMSNDETESSASYRALVFMSLSAGETAQTLRKNEYLISIFGYFDYGVTSDFSLGTLLPANFLSAPNVQGKYKFHESDSNIFSLGMNYFHSPESETGVVNATLFWDSVSSESVISHTNLTLALATFDNAKNLTALKGAGTSSLQSGYEFIMEDWNRVLVGPSYNFENKTVGGYVSYMWIWDQLHTLVGISTTDISNVVYNVQDGYYFNFDLYWRF